MSRVAKAPVTVPSGVEVSMSGQTITVKGGKGTLQKELSGLVEVNQEGGELTFAPRNGDASAGWAMAGTTRSVVNSMVLGVTQGFERKLQLVGVGYRAQASGRKLNLTLGFSHPVEYQAPEGISFETPSQTEIVVRGVDKQVVGQVAAKVRSFRPPEPYKGKGVRYADEAVSLKEAKKK